MTQPIDLFNPVVANNKQHPIFNLISKPEYAAERVVLNSWAEGFIDRDNKFVTEFQTTFESSMWELYIHAFLKELSFDIDLSNHAPDFVIKQPIECCIEATIAAPELGGQAPSGEKLLAPPKDFSEFNRKSILRICNSLSSKIKKYRKSYASLPHVKNKPYIIAIASFDRPHAHMAVNRAILASLYGIYVDEKKTIDTGAQELLKIPIDSIMKNNNANVPVGYFGNNKYSDVSAIIYSNLATWGKIRALAKSPESTSVYTTLHPNPHDLLPEVRQSIKKDYTEHLLDGLQIYHNPYAKHPLSKNLFNHERLAQHLILDNGHMEVIAPDDFLLMRMIFSCT